MNTQLILAGIVLLAAESVQATEKHPFNLQGLYSETFSCSAPCPCELIGTEKGCEGFGSLQLSAGKYNGQDLSGLKAVYAVAPGNWVAVYFQTAKPEQAKAAREFLTAVYTNWGKIEAIKEAKIDISGKGGNYTVTVDGGKIMKYQTKVVLGADHKNPIAHSNISDPLNHTFFQALSESGTYNDNGHTITLEKGTNAYFNDKMDASGEL